MKRPLIAISLFLAVAGSTSVAMAGTPQPANFSAPIRLAMMTGADGHHGYLPSAQERLHIGAHTMALGTFYGAMGQDETTYGYQLLKKIADKG